MDEDGGDSQTPSAAPFEEQAWGVGLIGRVVCSAPLLAFTVVALLDHDLLSFGDAWPLFVALPAVTVMIMRPAVRLTHDELMIRHPVGSERIPRAQVASARFNYFGLIIDLRGGGSAIAFILPKWTSTELSGDEPPADSAAYKITKWAQSGTDLGTSET